MRKLIVNRISMFLLAGMVLTAGAMTSVSIQANKMQPISELSHVSLQQKTASILFA